MDSRQFKLHLIDKTATELQQSDATVNSVINWMFRDVTKALKIYKEVELSGFGMLKLSQAKLKKRIIRLEEIKQRLSLHPQTEDVLIKLEGIEKSLQYFYSKTNETKQENILPDLGGIPQSINSSGGIAGGDSQSDRREASHM